MESTRNLILSLFPAQDQGHASLRGLTDRAEAFTRAGTRRTRLDALVRLFDWLRQRDTSIPELRPELGPGSWQGPEWRRERVWLAILESSPEVRDRFHAGVASILEETDALSLFAEAGLPNDRGLVPETVDRLFRIVLPAPRQEAELARLFLRLFPTKKEVERVFSLPQDPLHRIAGLFAPVEVPEAWEKPLAALLDAFCLLAARVQGLGLSEKLRVRSQRVPVQQSPFYRLPRASDALVEAVRRHEGTAAAAQHWKAIVADCRAELETIVAHLDASGVNLDIVYALDVIEQSLARMESQNRQATRRNPAEVE